MRATPGSTCTCWWPSRWLMAMPAARTRRICASSSRRTSASETRPRRAAWRAAASRCGSNTPSARRDVAAAAAPINGRCSVSTRCTPTARLGRAARERDGMLERRARGHDRRRRHDAAVVRLDDAAVHGLGNSEIVGVDDELERRRSSPLRERPMLHAEIVRRENRERQRQPYRERRQPGSVDEQQHDRGAAHERRGVQQRRTSVRARRRAPSARNVQSLFKHEAVREAGAVREHVRDGAAAARPRRAARY